MKIPTKGPVRTDAADSFFWSMYPGIGFRTMQYIVAVGKELHFNGRWPTDSESDNLKSIQFCMLLDSNRATPASLMRKVRHTCLSAQIRGTLGSLASHQRIELSVSCTGARLMGRKSRLVPPNAM